MSVQFDRRSMFSPRVLALAVGFAVATWGLHQATEHLQSPGPVLTNVGRETFVTVGSALTGPAGAVIIGISTGLSDPMPEPGIAVMAAHTLAGIFISLMYWSLLRRAASLRSLAAGWASLVAGYFLIMLLVSLLAGVVMHDGLDATSLSHLLVPYLLQAGLTFLTSGSALLALPLLYRFPGWRRGVDYRAYIRSQAGRAAASRRRGSLSVRVAIWFILFSVVPLTLVGILVQDSMTASITEQEFLHLRQAAVSLAQAFGENDGPAAQGLIRSYAAATGYDIEELADPAFQSPAWRELVPTPSARAQLAEEMRYAAEGQLDDTSAGRLIAFARVPGQSGVVVLSDGTGALVHKLRAAQRAFLLSVGGSLLLISLIGGLITWLYLGRPLSRFVWAAAEVGRGRLDVAIRTADLEGEMKLLADRFNTMTESLHQLRAGLEGKIAEHRATEAQLRESERRFREFADLLPQAVFEAKLDGTITYSNTIGLELFQLPPEELGTTLNLLSVVVPKDQPAAISALQDVAAGRRRTGNEYRLVRKDGTTFPALVYSTPVVEDGKVVGLRGMAVDVTDRKKAQEALRSSEEKFAKAFHISPDSVNINRMEDGMYVAANEGFTRLTGYTEEDVLGKTSTELSIWANPEDRARLVRGLKEKGEVIDLEAVFRRKDGSTLVGLMSARTIEINGELCLLNITRDITERKRAEESIAASLREKELLLKEIHHRVKNNLQVISSLLNLQANAVYDARDRELFNESQNRIRSMALVHEKLYQSEDLARVDFRVYLEGLLGWLFKTYRLPEVSCSTVVDDVHLTIDVAIPCGLLINELVANAMKHAFPDGRPGNVRVALRRVGESRLEVEVADDGVGLPPGAEARATAGLGLHLVQILAEQIGATLTIDRTAGTSFRVNFPVSSS